MAAATSLIAAFAEALACEAAPAPSAASLLGLEHEYSLWRGERPVDFRDLVHRLSVPGRRLDPGDSNAYRLNSGLVMTADDAEAEVATPPLDVGAGFSSSVAAWAAHGLDQLQSVLPPDVDAFGYSTHLSASLPLRRQAEVLDLFTRTFAPSLMLIMEKRQSFGVYVRPRPGRLEFCAEYVAGDYLSAGAAVFAGGVRACAAALDGDVSARSLLPPELNVTLRPANGRYGLFLSRRQAFGFDLYAAGRGALLPLREGGSITAQRQLELAVEAARQMLPQARADDLALAGRIVARALPLRVEAEEENEAPVHSIAQMSHPQGEILRRWTRPSYAVNAVVATWDFTVFQLLGSRQAFACVPREALPVFLTSLSTGRLDATIEAMLEARPTGRCLSNHAQTHAPGLWDSLEAGPGLIAPEPDSETGQYVQALPGGMIRVSLFQSARAGKVQPRPFKALLPLPPLVSRPQRVPVPRLDRPASPLFPLDGAGPGGVDGPPAPLDGAPPLVDATPLGGLLPSWWPIVAVAGAVLTLVAFVVFASAGGDTPSPTSPGTPTPRVAGVDAASISPTPARDAVVVPPASTPATDTVAPVETPAPAETPAPVAPTSVPAVETPVPVRPATPVPLINPTAAPETPVPIATPPPAPSATPPRPTATPAVIGVTVQKALTGFTGSQATFQISVTNPGPVGVNASVRDTLPPGVSIVSIGSAGWVCSTTPGAQGGATCTSAVSPGATLAFSVTVGMPVPFSAWQNCAALSASLPGSTSVATAQACVNVPASAAAPTPTPRPGLAATPTPRPCTPSPTTPCG